MKIDFHSLIELCTKHGVEYRLDEPMAAHTTFKVGGPADFYVRPCGEGFRAFAAAFFEAADSCGVPVFALGGGANIVAGDNGIRAAVLDLTGWRGAEAGGGGRMVLRAGTALDEAANAAMEAGLSGLEFLAGMPGTVGGAVWMNARAYGAEMADVLENVEILEKAGEKYEFVNVPCDKTAFGYKKSPFQGRNALIVSAAIMLKSGIKAEIDAKMGEYRRDRTEKGHYRYPSAGSAFKNNREFGKSTGKIIDECGLKGFSIGGAAVAPWHGNIIVNTGAATAADIKALAGEVARRVKAASGFDLEPEILFVKE